MRGLIRGLFEKCVASVETSAKLSLIFRNYRNFREITPRIPHAFPTHSPRIISIKKRVPHASHGLFLGIAYRRAHAHTHARVYIT